MNAPNNCIYGNLDCPICHPSKPLVIDGTGWAEAVFDEGSFDPQVLAMMMCARNEMSVSEQRQNFAALVDARSRQGLGYSAFARFK